MTHNCDVGSEPGSNMEVVTTLSNLSASAVAELLTKCLTAGSKAKGACIREYCNILRALGLIRNVAERTFDKLAQVYYEKEETKLIKTFR